MNNKKMKRVLAMALTLIMSTSIVACQDTSNNKESNGQNENSESNIEERELTTIKILCPADDGAGAKVQDALNRDIGKRFTEKLAELGIALEFEFTENAILKETVMTRMASQYDMPDLICVSNNELTKTIFKWGTSGLVACVDDLLESYDTDGSIKEFYGDLWDQTVQRDGKVYWFSYLTKEAQYVDKEGEDFFPYKGPYGSAIRVDWLEKIGEEYKMVYTPEELYELLLRVREADCNGDGIQNEVFGMENNFGWSPWPNAYGIYGNYPTYVSYALNYVTGERKDVECVLFNENLDECLSFMNRIATENLTSNTAFANNCAFVNYSYMNLTYAPEELPGVDDAVYYPIVVEADGNLENGHYIWCESPKGSSNFTYFIPEASKNKEAVIRLMDFIYSTEYAEMYFGVRGEDWDVVDKAIVDLKPEEDTTLYPLAMQGLPIVSNYVEGVKENFYDNRIEHHKKNGMTYFEGVDVFYDWNYNYSKYAYNSFVPYAAETAEQEEWMDKNQLVLDTYMVEIVHKIIGGSKTIDDLEAAREELKKLGIDEYIAIQQDRADRYWNAQ